MQVYTDVFQGKTSGLSNPNPNPNPNPNQVYTDVFKGKTSGLSAGFALTLVAETTSGALLSAEAVGAGGVLPEEVGTQAAEALLQQVRRVRG